VTLEGDVVRGPLVIGGKTEGGTPGVFSIKRELADLETALGSEESRASGIAIELQQVEEELRAADDTRILAEERSRSAEQDLRERRTQRERAGSELERFEKDPRCRFRGSDALRRGKKPAHRAEKHSHRGAAAPRSQERDTHEVIRGHEEQLSVALTRSKRSPKSLRRHASTSRAAAGNVNAIQREHENLSRIVISLGAARHAAPAGDRVVAAAA